ncbi:MAG: hypothetical protein ACI8X5_004053 [Planctomycetota bacterium]|jgi:hypothetical protein
MSHKNSFKMRITLSTTLLALASCQATAPDREVKEHAQRPFISQTPHTVAEDVIAVEMGAQVWSGHESELPIMVRYGLGEQTEFFVGTSPYKKVDFNEDLPDGSGWGDTYIGMRHRLREKDMYAPAWAVQIQTKLPTGRPSQGLGTGLTDWYAAVMANQTYYDFDTTAFYQLGILGETNTVEPDSNYEHTLAVQTRREMNTSVTALGEFAFVFEPEDNRTEATLFGGASFQLDSLTAVDVGLRVGLGDDAPDFQVLIGFSRALGMLFFPDN